MERLAIAGAGAILLGFMAHRMWAHLNDIKQLVPKEESLAGQVASAKVIQLCFFVIGCIIWPVAAVIILKDEWNNGSLVTHPLLWTVSLWVMVLLMIDIVLVSQTPAGTMDSIQTQQQEVKQTFMSVVGSVFAFGMLLTTISSTPEKRSKRAAQIGITGLLIGLAFAVPVLETHKGSELSYSLTSLTKIACLIAVAIFMSGIVVELVPH